MKITYVTNYDAKNVHNWSGLGYYIWKALENQNNEIEFVSNLKEQSSFIVKFKAQLYKRFNSKGFAPNRELSVALNYAKQIKSRLNLNTDIIFSPSTLQIALLKTSKPKVIYTDATFAGLIGFYEGFDNLCEETIRHGNFIEQQALNSSKLIIYSSEWAAKTAIENYKVDSSKIKVVPYGINFETKRSLNDIKRLLSLRSKDVCNLLFVGVDWKRKGGDMAIKIAELLNNLGVPTILHIVGIKSIPIKEIPKFVINHGFISKATEEGQGKLNYIFSNAHFFLLPTIADCTPVVFSEANSFGLPCLSNNVGGIPTIIKNDINGKRFDLNSSALEWSNFISNYYLNSKRYEELCFSSFGEYENRLNWDVAGKSIMKYLREI